MAIINIKNFGKVTVSDTYARNIKKDWTEMKQGLFPKETVIEIGDFTGSIGDITGFMIDPVRRQENDLIEYKKSEEQFQADRREIKSIGEWIKSL